MPYHDTRFRKVLFLYHCYYYVSNIFCLYCTATAAAAPSIQRQIDTALVPLLVLDYLMLYAIFFLNKNEIQKSAKE